MPESMTLIGKPAADQVLIADDFEATDGNEAWQIITEHRPKVVLLDVQMPGRDGLQLARDIRADPSLGRTQIILQSASAFPSEVAEGLASGADWYITKPIRVHEVTKLLGEALQRTRGDQES